MKVVNAGKDFYSCVDRLQAANEILYPDRKWSIEFYYDVAFAWMACQKDLEKKVLELEERIALSKPH